MSNSHPRSFAQKLSKTYATEVRKNISRHIYNNLENNNNNNNKSTENFVTMSLTESLEPIDYEEFLSENTELINGDPLKNILLFPSDDVLVKTIPRKIRTIDHIRPPENIAELSQHVQECVHSYTHPWRVIEYTNRQYSSICINDSQSRDIVSPLTHQFEIDQDSPVSYDDCSSFSEQSSTDCGLSSRQSMASLSSSSSCTDTLTPRSSWASFDLRNSINDPLMPNLLEEIPPDKTDKNNELKRQENRPVALFPLQQFNDPESFVERRSLPELPNEHIGHRLLIKCQQLRLELEVEPIFASMAIYDAKEKRKISENFYFDMNSDSLRCMLGAHIPFCDDSTQSREAIFEITFPSNDLFLVIRLEKVLQGDIKDSMEPYLKDDKEKYREKAKLNAFDFCARLGKYRMPFAWTAVHLANVFNGEQMDCKDSNNSIFEKEINPSLTSAESSNSLDRKLSTNSFDQLKRKSNDINVSLSRRGSLERKEKRRSWSPDEFGNNLETFRPISINITSLFKQDAEKMKDEDLYKHLMELKKPGSTNKKHKCIPGSIKLEILPCPESLKKVLTCELAKLSPYPDDNNGQPPVKEILEFPQSLIYNTHYTYRNLLYLYPRELNFSARAGSARNIAVRIQLLAGEVPETDAINAIFGKSSCPEFSNETYTVVNYHNKCPTFYDEVKIALPANLKQNHHIFFTIYHVSCQKKPLELQTTVETPIGYTWLPLLDDGKLKVGEFQLPVMVETPPENYSFISSHVHLPGTKWLDNHRPVFSIDVEAVTSIHTLDTHLDRFFLMCDYLHSRRIPIHIGDSNMEAEMKKCLLDIARSAIEPMIKNLHLILDKLIDLLVTTYKISGESLSLAPTVFETICLVVSRVATLNDDLIVDYYGRHSLLSTYVQYQCKIPQLNGRQRINKTMMNTRNEIITETTMNSTLSNGQRTDTNFLYMDTVITSTIMNNEREDIILRYLHEELALHWVVSSGQVADLAMANSWFFFDLIIKSMVEHLEQMGCLQSARKQKFPHQFTDDISTLVYLVISKVLFHHNNETKLAQSLNASLGFFIFDLFSVMDRGFVFDLIRTYNKVLIAKNAASLPELMSYKMDFLRIVCSHEHYIALNLPFGTPYTMHTKSTSSPTSMANIFNNNNNNNNNNNTVNYLSSQNGQSMQVELNADFKRQHFLIGLVLTDLITALQLPNSQLQEKAISCVRNLLCWHDLDPRYTSAEIRARIASLYLPLLNIILDTIPQLLHHLGDSNNDRLYNLLDHNYGGSMSMKTSTISAEVAYAISGSQSYTAGLTTNVSSVAHQSLSMGNARNLLICGAWIFKNLEKSLLYRWLMSLNPQRLYQILQMLNICIACFEYTGKKHLPSLKRNMKSFRKAKTDLKEKLEECIRGTNSARNDLINRRKDRNCTEKFRWRRDQMPYRSQFFDAVNKNFPNTELNYHIEGYMATEILLIVLDTLEILVQVTTNSEVHQNLLSTVLKVMLHALSRNQSTISLKNLFASQRSFIFKFPNILFDEESDICSDLCLLLLKHCGSQLTSVRSEAAASLYVLMRQNYEIANNFARIKMQVTMSLSSLVGTSSVFSEQTLRRALKTILVYAESDTELQNTSFPEQVQDLLFNLHMILSDTVKMKEYKEDPEMLLDLMNRIAKGYKNNPDLRLTWLESMAKKHTERSNHTEAAMCFVHSAALVAEFLRMLESQPYLPAGAVSFQAITPNALLESAVSDDVLTPTDDGICLGNRFTESGLKVLLEEAANSFQIAGMYEAMNQVYKILIPIYEANRDFPKLGKIHGKLQEAFHRISQLHGKRVLGTYFRVGFYGSKFGDLDQQEFIYKEPTLTKLPEIFNRLQNFYADRFGSESVQIIKDSNIVDVNSLDPKKAYIQITYVEPYFENYEFRKRETYFERNFNLRRFVYATPFTKSGKAHGDLHEQCKRKTILTTANHFPYVKTRIEVINRQQKFLEPIEVAIEDIQKKTIELAAATNQEPSDPKILQMVLQGCIGTTVNQGPMEMATVFLSNLADGATVPTKMQNKLRLCFKEFAKRCSDALRKNRSLILADQRDYQRELERNNEYFIERLKPLITLTATQLQGMQN